MLDNETKQQLSELFQSLESQIELACDLSQHEDDAQLLDLLEGVALSNSHIKVTKSVGVPGVTFTNPHFSILRNGERTGISFTGIPGGHEFSSLVLAILNTDGRGKLPDPAIRTRIKALKGSIRIKTYISLSCENCPDVVQGLNQMALIHPRFQHEMVDGSYVPEEIEALGIQGVPSIVVDNKLIHSGRIEFLDLLEKLETEFGKDTTEKASPETIDRGHYDVAILGGGPAGVSAAIYSARKGLKTALIAEKIGGQVQETRGIENLISVVYTEGPKLAAQLAEHLASYPVDRIEQRRVKSIEESNNGFLLNLESAETLNANRIIVTTGAKWRELGVEGEREYIGRGVAFCPHCDGPFYKGKKIAVIGGGNSGVEAAIDLAGIVKEVVLIEYADTLKADKVLVDKLTSLPNVQVLTGVKTNKIVGNGTKVTQLEYEKRSHTKHESLDIDGVFVQIGLIPNSHFLKNIVDLTPFGEIKIDNKCRTSKPGIYAAGDVTTTPYKQISIAMGEGAKAALAAFEDSLLISAESKR